MMNAGSLVSELLYPYDLCFPCN